MNNEELRMKNGELNSFFNFPHSRGACPREGGEREPSQ